MTTNVIENLNENQIEIENEVKNENEIPDKIQIQNENENQNEDKNPAGNQELIQISQEQSHAPFSFDGKVGRCHANVLLDSGATACFVNESFVRRNCLKTKTYEQKRIKLADGQLYDCNQILEHACISIGPYREKITPVYVVPLHEQLNVILGMSWLKLRNPNIDWVNRSLTLQHENHTIELRAKETQREDQNLLNAVELIGQMEAGEDTFMVLLSMVEKRDEDKGTQDQCNPEYANQLEALLQEYKDVFPDELPNALPISRNVDHKIELIPGAVPPVRPVFRLNVQELQELKKQLNELLEKGYIRPSKSPYGSPVLFVRKKDGSFRMCIDYRALNNITIRNSYPLPRIDDLLDQLKGAKYFTTLDLRSGYYQIRVHENDIEKTAFRTRYGHFEFLVMPFGLCNAPGTFQAMMNDIFRKELDQFVLAYIDDIMVYSKTAEEHLQHIRHVLEKLRHHRLYVSKKKCDFFKTKIKWVGNTISENGIGVDDSKVEAIKSWPRPSNAKQILSFLGLAGYYRDYIEHYAHIATPLSDLTKKNATFVWGPEQEEAFTSLIDKLCNAPVLAMPDPKLPYIINTDASEFALGAVLMQNQESGLKVIAYYSKKFNDTERRWATPEKECYAVLNTLDHWRHFLIGAPKSTVMVDHQPLQYLTTKKTLTAKQIRWLDRFAEYDTSIQYITGKSNVVADALSRRPDLVLHSMEVTAHTLKMGPEWIAEIKSAMGNDHESRKLMQLASKSDTYDLQNGLLFRNKDNTKQLFVPNAKHLRREIMEDHHDQYLAGHFGINKTLELLTRNYFWPRIAQDVQDFVKSCPSCMVSRSQNKRRHALLQPLPLPTKRFLRIHIDLVTDLGTTQRGHDSILSITEVFTGLVTLAPTTKQVDAQGIADLLFEHYVRHFGIPKIITSDRDPRWTSLFFKNLSQLLGIDIQYSTAYHPQTNGRAERTNRTVLDTLRCYAQEIDQDWDTHLVAVEFAINNATNASTGYSPFFLVYGEHPPSIPSLDLTELAEAAPVANVEEWTKTLTNHLNAARSAHEAAQRRQKRYADFYRRPITYKVGDQVLLATEHLRPDATIRKLSPKKCGPFKITEKVGFNAYKLDLPPEMRRVHPVFNVSLLCPYYHSSEFSTPERTLRPAPPDFLDAGPDVFLVDKLLDRRIRYKNKKRFVEYKVLWSGYPLSSATWEPRDSLLQGFNIKNLINEFDRRISK